MEECCEIAYRSLYLFFPQKIGCSPLGLWFRMRERLTEFVRVCLLGPGGARLPAVGTDGDLLLQLMPTGGTKKCRSHGNLSIKLYEMANGSGSGFPPPAFLSL